MSAGGWGCPHELDGHCGKVNNIPCDPGMKGCELYGRYAFFDGGKNVRLLQKQQRVAALPPEEGAAQAGVEAQPSATAGQAPPIDAAGQSGDSAVPKKD